MLSIDAASEDAGNPLSGRGAFLITIDTEGDNQWSKPKEITARNADALPRFQELCDRYGLKPTYLATWEMVKSGSFVEFGKDVMASGRARIGMHLHAWNSPPIVPLTDDDFRHQPYLIEYAQDVIREKVKVMTDTLEHTFGSKMLSHRAGRWGLNETYARILSDAGYTVDCSVTPHIDWRVHTGRPGGRGGIDYRSFPDRAYFLDLDDISRAGSSDLLELPMTIMADHQQSWARALRSGTRKVPHLQRLVHGYLPAYSWLRPNGRNGSTLPRLLQMARTLGRRLREFMLHSSELMAGGSPTFPTGRSIAALYSHLEALFDASTRDWVGQTLSVFRDLQAAAIRGATPPPGP